MMNTPDGFDSWLGSEIGSRVSEAVYLRALELDADAWREADSTCCSYEHHFTTAIGRAWLEEDDRLRELELEDERQERLYDAPQSHQDAQGTFNWTPMGYHNPCSMDTPSGRREAPFAIAGSDPDRRGGGILFWAYSDSEALEARDAYQAAGYHNVHIEQQ